MKWKCDRCQVIFTIDDDYKDIVWCDSVRMDAGDVLRWWMYDKNGIYCMSKNKYIIAKDGKVITLYPMKVGPP